MKIHKTALIAKQAKIAEDVQIGPYAVIGENVTLLKGTVIGAHTIVEGHTVIGEHNRIANHVSIGGEPQHKSYRGQKSFVNIGNRNVIREYTSVHRGSEEGSETRIGDHNFLMAYCHVAHDCRVGNSTVLTNMVQMSGHCEIGDNAVLGGMVGIHQFVRVGSYAMVGGMSRLVLDIPPYALVQGDPARVIGINSVGLKRAEFSTEDIRKLKNAYQKLFISRENLFQDALSDIRAAGQQSKPLDVLVRFIETSKRGITSGLPKSENRESTQPL
jgi:UDP-N-acetylglucosamine acyltransferase